jgi:hypothetical protein
MTFTLGIITGIILTIITLILFGITAARKYKNKHQNDIKWMPGDKAKINTIDKTDNVLSLTHHGEIIEIEDVIESDEMIITKINGAMLHIPFAVLERI